MTVTVHLSLACVQCSATSKALDKAVHRLPEG